MGNTVLNQAAVYTVGGTSGAAADVGSVDVQNVQAKMPERRSSFFG